MDLITSVKSWQTTVIGVALAVLILIPAFKAQLDDDPETNMNISDIVMALGLAGLGVAAKDGNRTSEDLGLTPKE